MGHFFTKFTSNEVALGRRGESAITLANRQHPLAIIAASLVGAQRLVGGNMFTSQADRLKRERMALRPFAPAGNADVRLPHAQEYSAFYLGEIAGHLDRLATSAERLDKTLETILSRMKPDIT
jgi:hypothetical protein